MLKTPTTPTPFRDKVLGKNYQDILLDVLDMPIMAWFQTQRKAIQRLVKITARLGDDVWFLEGYLGPRKLDQCLKVFTPKNGWTYCEFMDEAEFYRQALEYMMQKE